MNKTLSILLAVLLILILASGCCKETQTAIENKNIVMQGLEALSNQDFDRAREFIADDFKRHCQATPDVEINSLDDMIEFIKTWTDAFPDMRAEYHQVVTEGNMVAVYATYIGTHEGDMGDIPATGKVMESETFGIFRINNGKIAEVWVTWDNMAIMKQLGLMPPESEKTSDDI